MNRCSCRCKQSRLLRFAERADQAKSNYSSNVATWAYILSFPARQWHQSTQVWLSLASAGSSASESSQWPVANGALVDVGVDVTGFSGSSKCLLVAVVVAANSTYGSQLLLLLLLLPVSANRCVALFAADDVEV